VVLETGAAVSKGAKVEVRGAAVVAAAEIDHPPVLATLAVEIPKSLQATNTIRQLAIAMYDFHDVNGFCPGDVRVLKDEMLAWSWRAQILPYIGQGNLYNRLDFTKAWNDPANLKVLEKADMPKQFEHPNRPAPKGHTYFRTFTLPKNAKGKDRPWLLEGGKGPTLVDVPDGLSNTLMIVEASEAVPWYKPDVLAYDGVLPLPKLGDKSGRFLAAFADGSVRLFHTTPDEKTLRALITINGGEDVKRP
jgi:hypothetical protein